MTLSGTNPVQSLSFVPKPHISKIKCKGLSFIRGIYRIIVTDVNNYN